MNADEIVKKLRLRANTFSTTPECDKTLMEEAADLIESLQTDNDAWNNADCNTCPLATLEACDEICCSQIDLISFAKSVSDQLSASQRRADAAVEDLNGLGRFERERCAYCIHDDECEPGEMLCSYNGYTAFEWRGPQETGEGGTP